MFELRPYNNRRNRMQYYDPFRQMEEFEKEFFGNNLDFFPDFSNNLTEFRTDIKDNGDSYTLEADLPGFDKKDINVDISGGRLTISAERHSECEQKDKKNKYVRCERSYGSYSRSFDLSGVESDKITAKYDNGVLTLTCPKKKEITENSKRLEIE